MKYLTCVLLLFSTVSLHADSYAFFYRGAGVEAEGTLTTDVSVGPWNVVDIEGQRNDSVAIIDITAVENEGDLYFNNGIPAGRLSYGLAGSAGVVSVNFNAAGAVETIGGCNAPVQTCGIPVTSTIQLSEFYIRPLPEPSTLLSLLMAGFGAIVLAKKLPKMR
jgi:hypothetical protein